MALSLEDVDGVRTAIPTMRDLWGLAEVWFFFRTGFMICFDVLVNNTLYILSTVRVLLRFKTELV